MAHGATDEFGWHAVQDKVHVHDLHATILHLMGLDHEQADLPLRRPRLPPDRRPRPRRPGDPRGLMVGSPNGSLGRIPAAIHADIRISDRITVQTLTNGRYFVSIHEPGALPVHVARSSRAGLLEGGSVNAAPDSGRVRAISPAPCDQGWSPRQSNSTSGPSVRRRSPACRCREREGPSSSSGTRS